MRYILLFLALSAGVWAQNDRLRSLGHIEYQGSYYDFAEVDGGGEYAVYRNRLKIGVMFLEFQYEGRQYEWQDAASLPFGSGVDPWDELQAFGLTGRWRRKLSDKWMVGVRAGFGAAYESEMEDAWNWFVSAMLTWRAGEELMVFMGGMFMDHEEADRARNALPMLGLQWRKPKELGWSAQLGFPRSGVRHRFNPELAIDFDFLFTPTAVYRLADDNPVVARGYYTAEGAGLKLGATWSPQPKLDLSAGLLLIGQRKMEFYDARGDFLDDYEVDETLGISIAAQWRF